MEIRLSSYLLFAATLVAAAGSIQAQEAVSPASGVDPGSSSRSVPVAVPAQDAAATPLASAQPVSLAPGAAPATSELAATQIAEVVVIANKRKESTRTIAGGVTAITQDQLNQTGASSMAEYLSLAPGVNFDASVPGYSVIAIRGISGDTIPGETQSAVGTYYDDIPLTDPGSPLVAIASGDGRHPQLIVSAGQASQLKGWVGRLFAGSERAGKLVLRMQENHRQTVGRSQQGAWDRLPHAHGALVFSEEGAKDSAARILDFVRDRVAGRD